MASYFDEHDCEPLGENQRPDNQILLARLLLDSGIADVLGMSFDELASNSGHNLPPATSKEWLKNEYPKHCFNESERPGYQCPICLKDFSDSDKNYDDLIKNAVELPGCKHAFHCECLLKWLEHTSSCPLCRHELPTDDSRYEEFKRQQKRQKIREQELAALHDSMYS